MAEKSTKRKSPSMNAQKGKKKCTCCHNEKKLTDFYASYSSLFSIDKRVPICKECVYKLCTDEETGEIDIEKMKNTLRSIDKPMYLDLLASSCEQFKHRYGFVDDEDVIKYSDKVLGIYFKNIMLPQDRYKGFAESEKEGFYHKTSPIPMTAKAKVLSKYTDLKTAQQETEEKKKTSLSKKDRQNMKYVISMVGYDPFDNLGLSDEDRRYCYNTMSGYCDIPGVSEDGHKMQSVIEMTILYSQCRRINEEINSELTKSEIDDTRVSQLTKSKSTLISSINSIAKDNNISSNYNKQSRQGQDSISSMIKEMEENDFENIKVNLFDIKTAEAFRQIDEISNKNIANQLMLDNNDYTDIIREQREKIKAYESQIDELTEENRQLQNKVIVLENTKGR